MPVACVQQRLPLRRPVVPAGARSTTAGGCTRHRVAAARPATSASRSRRKRRSTALTKPALARRALPRGRHRLVDQRVLGVRRRLEPRPQQRQRGDAAGRRPPAAAPSAPSCARTAWRRAEPAQHLEGQRLRARARVGGHARQRIVERAARRGPPAPRRRCGRADARAAARGAAAGDRRCSRMQSRSRCALQWQGHRPRRQCSTFATGCRHAGNHIQPIFRNEEDLAQAARVRAHPLPPGRRRLPLPRQRQHRRLHPATASSTS